MPAGSIGTPIEEPESIGDIYNRSVSPVTPDRLREIIATVTSWRPRWSNMTTSGRSPPGVDSWP